MSDLNVLMEQLESGRPKLLLIDDDVRIMETLKDILEGRFAIQTASSGKAAIDLLNQSIFNLVVVDFQLPDLTGLELARKIREKHADTAVILMTGHASLEMAVKAIQEAVYDYLIKPVDPAQLQKTLEKALEKQKLVLENKQLFANLQETNEKMARVDILKSRMIAVMSHDLRTPLASIRGYSDLLRSGIKGKLTENQKRLLEITIQESDYLNGLIGDLLDLASVEAGDFHLDKRIVGFDEVIQKVLPRMKMISEMKEVGLDLAIEPNLPQVDIDVNRIVQVLSNLLRSTFKHSSRGGRVTFTVMRKGAVLDVRMTQAGHGFTPDQLSKLFIWTERRYVPGQSSHDGLRVGLAIARDILSAHKGQLGVESDGVDKGCTFWIQLPIHSEKP